MNPSLHYLGGEVLCPARRAEEVAALQAGGRGGRVVVVGGQGEEANFAVWRRSSLLTGLGGN